MLKWKGTEIGQLYRASTYTVRFLFHFWYSLLSDPWGKTSFDHYLQEEFTVNICCTVKGEKSKLRPHSHLPHSSLRHSSSKCFFPITWALLHVSLWQVSRIKMKVGLLTTQSTCLLFNFSWEWKVYSAFPALAPHCPHGTFLKHEFVKAVSSRSIFLCIGMMLIPATLNIQARLLLKLLLGNLCHSVQCLSSPLTD